MKIIAFSNGSSYDTSTWSNVPYYFLKALEKSGEEVIRVNIKPFAKVKLINHLLEKLIRTMKLGITYERTDFYNGIVKRKMLKAVKRNPDANLLLTFDFSHSVANETKIKTLLLCDWDIKYLIEKIDRRTPTDKEKRLIEQQSKIIDSADYAVSIFPKAYEEMKKTHKNMHYLGIPVNIDCPDFDIEEAQQSRYQSKRLLFIGKGKYLSCARELEKALENFNSKNPKQKIYADIIGMDESDTKISSEFITHHGYLNKNKPDEWATYESLLRGAYFFINTTDNWVGASSILDTAYLGIPCIINPNEDLTETFEGNIDFGYLCNRNSAEKIEEILNEIASLSFDEYKALSNKAHARVKDFTYDNYVRRIIQLISD